MPGAASGRRTTIVVASACAIVVVVVIIRVSSPVPAPVKPVCRRSTVLMALTTVAKAAAVAAAAAAAAVVASDSASPPHVCPVLSAVLSGVDERQSEPAHEPNADQHGVAQRVDDVDFERRRVRPGPCVCRHEVERGPTAHLSARLPQDEPLKWHAYPDEPPASENGDQAEVLH